MAKFGDVPRNALCPCGSGQRFKHCHGRLDSYIELDERKTSVRSFVNAVNVLTRMLLILFITLMIFSTMYYRIRSENINDYGVNNIIDYGDWMLRLLAYTNAPLSVIVTILVVVIYYSPSFYKFAFNETPSPAISFVIISSGILFLSGYVLGNIYAAHTAIRALTSNEQKSLVDLIDKNRYAAYILEIQGYQPKNIREKIYFHIANSYSGIRDEPDKHVLEYALYSGDIYNYDEVREYFFELMYDRIAVGVDINISDVYRRKIEKFESNPNEKTISEEIKKIVREDSSKWLYEETKTNPVEIKIEINLHASTHVVVCQGKRCIGSERGTVPYVSGSITMNDGYYIFEDSYLGNACRDQLCTITTSIKNGLLWSFYSDLQERFVKKYHGRQDEILRLIEPTADLY